MKTHRPLVPALAIASAFLAITSTASADKLVVFKNGKVMLAKAVTVEGEWLKCEFEGGNFLSIPGGRVASIEESTLPEGARGGPVNQLIDGPRGAANMPSGPSIDADAPRAAGRGAVQAEPPTDNADEMSRALAEEAELRRTFGSGSRNRAGQAQQPNAFQQQQQLQQQQQFQPIPGLNQGIPGMQPITAPSTNLSGRRRSRLGDRGIATQQPGQEQAENE